MEHIYIMSCQRSQGSPEIFSIWDTYEKSIIAYYNYCVDNKSFSFSFNYMFLYRIPVNQMFCDNTKWSDVKLQKSSKYRIKFVSEEALKQEAQRYILKESRDAKLNELGI